ncbi:MAG TPA: cell wall biosynthesis glycosyltransferase [Bryobacteraceae bacterium]|nr:cell wall biosynthesis glycosyltransferase [Bryobacteraceae bacterium]
MPAEARSAVDEIRHADIVVGIPSFNNSKTIGHVVQAAHAGLAKYFPQFNSIIINSDGGSKDGTPDVVTQTSFQDAPLLMLNTPLKPVHRLSFPYHGIPGKGSAFRMIFQMASMLDAKACVVVDSDLRSITPEWFDLLIRPVIDGGFDFVAPYYHRHKYDGTITNSIVYPLTRSLYGQRLRQPIGGDFGMSHSLIRRYLERDDWETDVARFGIDIWMTTIAVAEGFKVCQSFLGAKLHDAKDPGADLSAMLQQVTSSVFLLMREYQETWRLRAGSEPAPLFGFRYDVGLDPVNVNLDRMLAAFRGGAGDLAEVWRLILKPDTLAAVTSLAKSARAGDFHLDDELWVRIVYEFACSARSNRLERTTLLKSITPLYLGRVASFVIETAEMGAAEVEGRIESLCLSFEAMKPYLIEIWFGEPANQPAAALPPQVETAVRLEV